METDVAPLLWQANAPNGQTMYLFGSMHIADESIYPLPDYIMDAFSQSDCLAVEVNLLDISSSDLESVQIFQNGLIYQDGKTIVEDIGEEFHSQAVALLEAYNINIPRNNQLPSVWYNTLSNLTTLHLSTGTGIEADYGLDMYFLNTATECNMEIRELETLEEQFKVLHSMPQLYYVYSIEQLVDQLEKGYEDSVLRTIAIYDAWKKGDEQYLRSVFFEATKAIPEMHREEYIDIMLTQRNIQMLEKAKVYMAEGRNVFLVVGYSHLVAEGNNIVDLLIKSGYEVVKAR